MKEEEIYMKRCIELAKQGAGFVAPNPMVGAVLVHGQRIIGEGYHWQYGQAHAEVNCVNSVNREDAHLIAQATLYVSLEPCAHFGKTPPCADMIIQKKIPKVVVGCRDPFKEVDGKGIEKLLAAGIEVRQGLLESECMDLNRRFFTFHIKQRPYIILKWAGSNNAKIGSINGERIFISNEFTNRLSHKWRSEESSILIGTNTALYDDPELNVRLWNGLNPIRLVIDVNLRLPQSLRIFDDKARTIIFNYFKHQDYNNVLYYKVTHDMSLVGQVARALYQLNIQSVLVEGGAKLLQSFLDEGMWDEARVIENGELTIENGLSAPVFDKAELFFSEKLFSDSINYYKIQNT